MRTLILVTLAKVTQQPCQHAMLPSSEQPQTELCDMCCHLAEQVEIATTLQDNMVHQAATKNTFCCQEHP